MRRQRKAHLTAAQPRDPRTSAGYVRPGSIVSGAHFVDALLVRALRVRHRADDRHLLRVLRDERQVAGDADAVGFCGDGLGRALARGARLGVEGIDVAHAALHEKIDDACRLRLAARLGRHGERDRCAADRQQADAEKGARGVGDELAAVGLIGRWRMSFMALVVTE
jgi:hypothetical protein